MNPAEVYRTQAVYTAPPHVQIAQLHQQAAVWTRGVHADVEEQKIVEARQKIQYIQDIITFLRSSLDFQFEVSKKTESTYIFYYNLYVDWFLHPDKVIEDQEAYESAVEYWESWAKTWMQANKLSAQNTQKP